MKWNFLAVVISSLLIFLLGYTGISKWMDHERFAAVLSRVPLMEKGAAVTAILLPLAELLIVLLLLFPATRLAGLWASLALLITFTAYLACMLVFMPDLPCSCGGVISSLGWREHVLLNTGLMALCAVAIKVSKTHTDVNKKLSFPTAVDSAKGD